MKLLELTRENFSFIKKHKSMVRTITASREDNEGYAVY